jgi:TolA-binding protein
MRTAHVILLMIFVWVPSARADVIWSTYYEKPSGELYGHGDGALHRYAENIRRTILTRTAGLRYAYGEVFRFLPETPELVVDISFTITPTGKVKGVSAERTYLSDTKSAASNDTVTKVFEDEIARAVSNILFIDITGPYRHYASDWTVKLKVRFLPENAPVEETTPGDWPNDFLTEDPGFKYLERIEKRETDKYFIEECIIDGVEFDEIIIKSQLEKLVSAEIPRSIPDARVFKKAAKAEAEKPAREFLKDIGKYFDERREPAAANLIKKRASLERQLGEMETALAEEELRLNVAGLGLSDEYDWHVKRPDVKKLAKLREKHERLSTEIEKLKSEISTAEEKWSRSLADERDALIARGEELLDDGGPGGGDPWLSFALAEIYLDSGEGTKAAGLLEPMIETAEPEMRSEALYGLDHAYLLSDGGEKAPKAFFRLTRDYPESPHVAEAYFRLGAYFERQREPLKAEKYLILAAESDDGYRDAALYRAGWAFYECSGPFGADYYDRAVPAFKRFLDAAEEGSPYWDHAFEMAGLCLAEWEPGTAERPAPLDALIRYDANFGGADARRYSADVLRALGEAYLYKMDKLPEATATYKRLLEKYPSYGQAPAVAESLVETYLRREAYDDAHAARLRLVDEYGPASSWYRAQGEPTRCRALLRWEDALYEVGVYYNMQAERKIRTHPEEGQTLFENAIDSYNEYLTLFPTNEKAYHINFYLAECYFAISDFETAAQQYIKTATHYTDRERYNLDKWDQRFTQEQSFFNAISSYGELYEETLEAAGYGEIYADKLLNTCEEFLTRYPESTGIPEILKLTGETYAREGDSERARAYYYKIIEEYPDPDDELFYSGKLHGQFYVRTLISIAKTFLREAETLEEAGDADGAGVKRAEYEAWYERAKVEAEKRNVDFEYVKKNLE